MKTYQNTYSPAQQPASTQKKYFLIGWDDLIPRNARLMIIREISPKSNRYRHLLYLGPGEATLRTGIGMTNDLYTPVQIACENINNLYAL
jgi:hypothetical protein